MGILAELIARSLVLDVGDNDLSDVAAGTLADSLSKSQAQWLGLAGNPISTGYGAGLFVSAVIHRAQEEGGGGCRVALSIASGYGMATEVARHQSNLYSLQNGYGLDSTRISQQLGYQRSRRGINSEIASASLTVRRCAWRFREKSRRLMFRACGGTSGPQKGRGVIATLLKPVYNIM